MSDYYYQLENSFLSHEETDILLKIVQAKWDDFAPFIGDNPLAPYVTHYNNIFLHTNIFRTLAEFNCSKILKMLFTCKLKAFPTFARQDPFAHLLRHKDISRKTILSVPLSPIEYSPTYFWEDKDSAEPLAIATFPDKNPCLMNVDILHGLENLSSEYRINFQIGFREPFSEVRKYLNDGSLFPSVGSY